MRWALDFAAKRHDAAGGRLIESPDIVLVDYYGLKDIAETRYEEAVVFTP